MNQALWDSGLCYESYEVILNISGQLREPTLPLAAYLLLECPLFRAEGGRAALAVTQVSLPWSRAKQSLRVLFFPQKQLL